MDNIAGVKWDWLNKQLHSHRHAISDVVSEGICIVTWNVSGAAPPPPPDLRVLFPASLAAVRLVVVGLQEVQPADQTGWWGGEDAALRLSADWCRSLHSALESDGFRVKFQERMAGILLVVLCAMEIEIVGHGTAACGLMGYLGNKGGVGIKLRLWDCWLTFVNCHLAAHPEYTARRNQDYREIRSRLLLPSLLACENKEFAAERALEILRASWFEGVSVDDADGLFWLGDLNYRLSIGRPEALKLIDARDYRKLAAQCDQLKQEQRARRAFQDFTEPDIEAFPPTYKFDPGTNEYDTSEKNRCPAYCDRILFKTAPLITPISYSSPPMLISDHKPVCAVFQVDCVRINQGKFNRRFEELLHSLDSLENAQIPQTELVFSGTPGVLDFGQIRFMRPRSCAAELRNNGTTAAQFSFSPEFMKPWIKVSPMSGILLPGSAAQFAVDIFVEAKDAYLFRGNQDSISSTVLVLNVHKGKDHFVAIEGTFKDTLFARDIQLDTAYAADGVPVVTVPMPLKRLGEHIVQHIDVCPYFLLRRSASEQLLDTITDCIDDNAPLPQECRAEDGMLAVGECLLRWLDCLPAPVIAVHEPAKKFDMVEEQWVVFEYIMSMFRGRIPPDRLEPLAWTLGRALTRRPKSDKMIVDFILKAIVK